MYEPKALCITDERFGSIERYRAFGDGMYYYACLFLCAKYTYINYLLCHHIGPKFICGVDVLAAKSNSTSDRCLV